MRGRRPTTGAKERFTDVIVTKKVKISDVKRCVVIHGHFYQPPRENPWTGAVERQPSAGQDHDWNARIARECYIPNGEARVMDSDGHVIDVVDNYAWLSFNFGPTLLAWLETAQPRAYARLIAADRESATRLNGHGNAIAQAYHHTILPLADPRDRLTEIRWGLFDFERRFGRKSEGLWLPECAADDATLAAAAGEGVAFVILEPQQAQGVRPVRGGEWTPADEGLKTGQPYLWRGAQGETLAVFFYDGPASRAVAFEGAMRDSRAYAARLSALIAPAAEDALALVATDGESYGHHEPFAEMGLAHLLRYALKEKGLEPVNLGWYLAQHPPRFEVQLKPGGSSWSCAHGIERWRADCGCGAEGGRHQRWRAPLREALEGLRLRLAELYEQKSANMLKNPWAARDAYVAVDGASDSLARFLAEFAPDVYDAPARTHVLRLMEMQRHALMMFTSCGWFFDEVSRLEPTQILLYAARAVELARDLGVDLEPDFVAALARVPSNDPEIRDGAGVWERLVKPGIQTRDHVAAHFAVSLLFDEKPASRVQGREVRVENISRRGENNATVVAGRASFVEPATRDEWARSFFAAVLPGQRVQAYVCEGDIPQASVEGLLADAARGTNASGLPGGRHFSLRDLRPDEREKVLGMVLQRRLHRWESRALEYLEETLPLVEQFHGLGLPLPANLGEEARLVLGHLLAYFAGRLAEGDVAAIADYRAALRRGRAVGINPPTAGMEIPWEQGLSRLLEALERDWSLDALKWLGDAVELAAEAGFEHWRPSVQTRFFRLWRSRSFEESTSPAARRAASALDIADAQPSEIAAPAYTAVR